MQPDWVKILTDGYSQGYSDIEICRDLKITNKQFNKMYDENDKFAELIDFGRMLSQAWWMEKSRTNLGDKGFNTPLFVINMKNRYGWAEKTESTRVDHADSISVSELRLRLEKDLPKLIKTLNPEVEDFKILRALASADILEDV